MANITRRAALATLAVGPVAAAVSGGVVAAAAPHTRLTNLKALPPHWLDPVIGNGEKAEEIAGRFGKNKTFIDLIAKAIKEVKAHPPKPGIVGPTYPQRVRLKIMEMLCDDEPTKEKEEKEAAAS